MEERKYLFRVTYENYGINGENPEGDYTEVNVVACCIETAILLLRSSLPKSLEYDIRDVEKIDGEVLVK